jgi:hypothetical protein
MLLKKAAEQAAFFCSIVKIFDRLPISQQKFF